MPISLDIDDHVKLINLNYHYNSEQIEYIYNEIKRHYNDLKEYFTFSINLKIPLRIYLSIPSLFYNYFKTKQEVNGYFEHTTTEYTIIDKTRKVIKISPTEKNYLLDEEIKINGNLINGFNIILNESDYRSIPLVFVHEFIHYINFIITYNNMVYEGLITDDIFDVSDKNSDKFNRQLYINFMSQDSNDSMNLMAYFDTDNFGRPKFNIKKYSILSLAFKLGIIPETKQSYDLIFLKPIRIPINVISDMFHNSQYIEIRGYGITESVGFNRVGKDFKVYELNELFDNVVKKLESEDKAFWLNGRFVRWDEIIDYKRNRNNKKLRYINPFPY